MAGQVKLPTRPGHGWGDGKLATGLKFAEKHILTLSAATIPAIVAIFSQWDHHKEKKRITREFEKEIGAQLGKSPGKVSIGDMEKVAKKNPAIHEALRRSTARRNLSIGVTIVSAVAAAALGGWIMPAAAGFALLAPVVSFAAFMSMEFGLTKIGEKALKIDEPEIHKVVNKPKMQAELSVSSQITYLAHLQSKGQRIGQAQVMTVMISANPELQAQIKSRYGVAFAGLPDNTKLSIMQELGGKIDIAQLTDDINSGNVRIQELAFATQGQMSGVTRPGTPHAAETDAPNAQLAQNSAPDTKWQDYERQRQAARARTAEMGA